MNGQADCEGDDDSHIPHMPENPVTPSWVCRLFWALKKLGRKYPDGKLCFCDMRLGHPNYREHDEECIAARELVFEIEKDRLLKL